MDGSLTMVRAFLVEPVDQGLSSALAGLSKGETSALCYTLRYCLSNPRFRTLAAHLRKQGYVLTLGIETRYIETIMKIVHVELGFAPVKVTMDDLLTSGNTEKKKSFVVDFLSACAKKNDELEREATATLSSNGRRRSYSAGSEFIKPPLSGIPRHPKGDDDPAPEPRIARPNFIEPWVTPQPISQPQQGPSPRTQFYSRTSPAAAHTPSQHHPVPHVLSPHKDEDHTLGNGHGNGHIKASATVAMSSTQDDDLGRDYSGSSRLSLQTAFHRNISNTLSRSTSQNSDDDSSAYKQKAETPPLALSPRERLTSPQRKSPAVVSASPSLVNNVRRSRRLELDDDQTLATLPRASPVEPPSDFGERLSRLESRLDSEFADLNERFSRLEKSLADMTKLLLQNHRARGDEDSN